MSVTQELPKYLRGFHKCSREDAVHLAGLIYKAQFDDDRSHLASIPKILKELVPENLTRLMSSEEWKKVLSRDGGRDPQLLPYAGPAGVPGCRAAGLDWVCCSCLPHTVHGLGASCGGLSRAVAPTQALTGPPLPQSILLACDKHRDKTVEEAKVAFLKWICRWPTFGSAFFEVKVGHAPDPGVLAKWAPHSPGSSPTRHIRESTCARGVLQASGCLASWPR